MFAWDSRKLWGRNFQGPSVFFDTQLETMSNMSEKFMLELVGFGIDHLRFDSSTFAHLSAEFQVEDIGSVVPGMRGKGIRVAGLLELANLKENVDHVTFVSQDGQYSSSLSLGQARDFGILVYDVDGKPLPLEKGGPFRLVTPGLGDLCANVKSVGQIKLSAGPGKDMRPQDRSC